MLMLPLIGGNLAAAGGSATIEYRDSGVDTGGPKSSWTFSSLDIGSAAADRVILVGVTNGSGTVAAINGVSVAGNSATAIVQADGASSPNEERAEIWAVAVASGTTGDVVVTTSAADRGCGVVVWAAYGISTTAHDTATDAGDPMSVSIDIPAGGVCVGFCAVRSNSAGSSRWTWTGLTEDIDGLQWGTTGGDIASGASLNPSTTQTGLSVTATYDGTEVRAAPLAVASFDVA
jgi:hypothetical protein